MTLMNSSSTHDSRAASSIFSGMQSPPHASQSSEYSGHANSTHQKTAMSSGNSQPLSAASQQNYSGMGEKKAFELFQPNKQEKANNMLL